MSIISEMKSKSFSIDNIIFFLLLVVGLAFNWTVLRNRSISFGSLNINIADLLLILVIMNSVITRKLGIPASYLSRFLVLSHLGTFFLGAAVCILNLNGNIDILIRSSRGFLVILLVCVYTKTFDQKKVELSFLTTTLACPIALIFYLLNNLGIINYGNFEFTTTATTAVTSVSDDGIQKFFFIEFVSVYLCIGMCFFLFSVCKKNFSLKFLAALGVFSCYGIMATNLSRTFIILLLLFSVLMIFNVYKYNRTKSFHLFIVITSGIIIGLILFWITQGNVAFTIALDWFKGIYDPAYDNYGSPEVRLSYINSSIEAFSDSPLFGHGIGADFTYYLKKFGHLENPYNFGNVLSIRIAQTGLVGFFLWLSFNLILIKHIYFNKAKNSTELFLKNTLFLVHIIVIIAGLTYKDSTATLSQGLVYCYIILIANYVNKHQLPQL